MTRLHVDSHINTQTCELYRRIADAVFNEMEIFKVKEEAKIKKLQQHQNQNVQEKQKRREKSNRIVSVFGKISFCWNFCFL